MKNLFLIFLINCCLFCSGQNKSHDDILYEAVVNTAGTDIAMAMKMADSLNRISTKPLHKVKSLMLLAELNLTTGKKKEALNYAFEAEELASSNNLSEWHARIFGFIASHYRSIGLKKQSKIYLNKGLEAIADVEDIHIVNQYKGLVYQELALYEIEDNHYASALGYLKKAEPCFSYIRNKELRSYQLATNYGQLGRVYINLKNKEEAITNFTKALALLEKIEHEATVIRGFIYEGIGRTHLEDKDFKSAIVHLKKALAIAEKSNDASLNEEVYCDLAIYYLEKGSKEEFRKYNSLYQAAREEAVKVNKDSSEVVVNRLEQWQKQVSFQHNLIFTGLGITMLILIYIVIRSRAKRKKQYARFREILKNRVVNIEVLKSTVALQEETISDVQEKELMSKEAEQAILDKLHVFEQGDEFTNKSINLASLSVMLGVNSKYLSYTINKHKKKDFSNYINELRIFYIIKKLESSPEYLNYKISYLAEKSGFSSHSKFTEKFKMVVDMSPSTFIGFLQKQKNEG